MNIFYLSEQLVIDTSYSQIFFKKHPCFSIMQELGVKLALEKSIAH